MERFYSLLAGRPGLTPGARQRFAESEFPKVVAASNLRLWRVGRLAGTLGRWVVIGVGAGHSGLDMRTLDLIDERLAGVGFADVTVDVFDVGTMKGLADLEGAVPGISEVFHTPVVGFWVDGEMRHRSSGGEARRFLEELFNIRVPLT